MRACRDVVALIQRVHRTFLFYYCSCCTLYISHGYFSIAKMYFFFLSSVKQLAFTEVPNPPPPTPQDDQGLLIQYYSFTHWWNKFKTILQKPVRSVACGYTPPEKKYSHGKCIFSYYIFRQFLQIRRFCLIMSLLGINLSPKCGENVKS